MRAERGWLAPTLALAGAVTALRLVLLALNQTDLFVDETQYWLWGQEFAFGYYSKPPLIGWLIGGVTWLAGSDAPFWVRMPGAVLHGATAVILAALAARLHGGRVALWVAAAYLSLPMVGLGSLLMSTDTVMAPFFAAALLFHHRLVARDRWVDALMLGAMIGLAVMAKYVGAFALFGVALAALFRRDQRFGWGRAVAVLLAFGLVAAPNLVWNLTHGLTTFAHTADNIGWVRDADGPQLHPEKLAEFVLSQFAVMGPLLVAALLYALRRPAGGTGLGLFVLPALLVVCTQALLDQAYANWAVSAYFAGTILAVAALSARPTALALAVGINAALCLALPLLTLAPGLAYDGKPLLARYLGRAEMSRQILELAATHGNLPILADNRDVLADLFYTGRDAGVQIFAPRPKGRAMNHYEQRYPMPDTATGPLLLITETPPACAGAALPLDATGGAYAHKALAAYLTTAGCVHGQ